MDVAVELLIDAQSEVGESAVWDWRNSSLSWVDLFRGELMTWNGLPDFERVTKFDQPLGLVVPTQSGGWLAGARDGCAVVDSAGRRRLVVPVEADRRDRRMNDGKTDPWGRVWAGTLSDESYEDGALYCLAREGDCRTVRTDLALPNGIAWSVDGGLMYIVDSNRYCVEVWEMKGNPESHPTRLVNSISVSCDLGKPDGIAVDTQGGLWVALFGSSAVVRFNNRAEIDARIELPVPHVTTLAFFWGGGRRSTISTSPRPAKAPPFRLWASARVKPVRSSIAGRPLRAYRWTFSTRHNWRSATETWFVQRPRYGRRACLPTCRASDLEA